MSNYSRIAWKNAHLGKEKPATIKRQQMNGEELVAKIRCQYTEIEYLK
jgi:hypothetical protein